MRTLSGTTLFGAAAALLLAVNAQAALISTDGGLGVYDTTNNVTWTSNANLEATQASSYSGGAVAFVSAVIAASGGVIHDTPNAYDTVPNSGTYTLSASDFNMGNSGMMTWWGAQAWVNYLDATNYGGSNRWALPTTVDNDSSFGYPNGGVGNPSQTSSQLAQLFYGDLGEVAHSPISATHNGNYALFSNVIDGTYWSTEYSAQPIRAWGFYNGDGVQGQDGKLQNVNVDLTFALAVSPGQVSAVPLPAAAWLMLSGLGGLGALARKKRAG